MDNSNSVVILTRKDFLEGFIDIFLSITKIGRQGEVLLNTDGWEWRHFEFDLWGFVWDRQSFDSAIDFVSGNVRPRTIILAEIETKERFTEVLKVACVPAALQNAMNSSVLPHFRSICFSLEGTWALLFDNALERTTAIRRPDRV